MNLPPLPEPGFSGYASKDDPDEYFSYTAEQMREYGQLCRQQALDEAAQVCEARFMGDLNREDLEARRCANEIRRLIK